MSIYQIGSLTHVSAHVSTLNTWSLRGKNGHATPPDIKKGKCIFKSLSVYDHASMQWFLGVLIQPGVMWREEQIRFNSHWELLLRAGPPKKQKTTPQLSQILDVLWSQQGKHSAYFLQKSCTTLHAFLLSYPYPIYRVLGCRVSVCRLLVTILHTFLFCVCFIWAWFILFPLVSIFTFSHMVMYEIKHK